MATRTVVTMVDDIDGTEIDETSGEHIEFVFDGVEYSIDLKTEHAKEFRESMEYWSAHATKVGGRKRAPKPVAAVAAGKLSAIRTWAGQNGFTVAPKGRIPDEVQWAYDAAHA